MSFQGKMKVEKCDLLFIKNDSDLKKKKNIYR